jgi:hypothetical protein
MTPDIVLADSELAMINGAIGATTVLDIIASGIENMTPASLIPPPNYSAWSFGPNAGGGNGGYGGDNGSYGFY